MSGRHQVRGKMLSITLALLLAISTILAACGAPAAPAPVAAPQAEPTQAPQSEPTKAPEPTTAASTAAVAAVACSGELPLIGKGPNGEEPTPLSALALTPEDEAKIKAGDFKAGISMHFFAADWPQLQIKGISDTLAKYGVEVIATTDGELKAEKQVADMENLIQLKPDVILHIPVDNDALAAVDKKVQEAGIKLVLIDSKPTGLEPGKDYVGLGAADNYANGAAAAEIIAERIGGKGKVALMRWGFHVFQTEQRRDGALATFKEKYPDIEIVFDQDVNSVEETTTACENLLTKYPDLAGVWTAWDGMGTACTQAANGMGRKDVVITSIDVSKDSGLWIAKDSPFQGMGAQHPYDQGVAEAMIALYALAGKEAPPYVVIPGRKVVRDNIVCSMESVFHEPPSQELIDAAGPQTTVEGAASASKPSTAAVAAVACSGELPLIGKGPNGEEPTPLSALALTPEDEAKIKAGDFKAGISMHFFAADWPQLQIKGISDTLAKYGVEVIATTDGELKAEKQVADMENLIQLKPDVILHIPVDNDALAAVDKKVQEAGIKLVLIDSKPTGLEPGKDYVGLGAADNYANGAAAAEIIAERIGGKGKVALMRWGFHVFQTEQRRDGALATFKEKYPDIEIVFDQDVNSVEETTTACENLLTKYPDLAGVWTAWDGMGTACTQAANGMGRKDVVITSIDVSKDSGLWIAKDSPFQGTGAQHPYDQGVAEAMIALYALAGKEAPPYVVIPGRKVVRDNIVCSMESVFHEPPSQELIDAAGPQK